MTNEELAKLIAGHKCNTADENVNCKVCPFLYCGACTLNVVTSWVKRGIENLTKRRRRLTEF